RGPPGLVSRMTPFPPRWSTSSTETHLLLLGHDPVVDRAPGAMSPAPRESSAADFVPVLKAVPRSGRRTPSSSCAMPAWKANPPPHQAACRQEGRDPYRGAAASSSKRLERGLFLFLDVEQLVQFGDFKDLINLRIDVAEN